MGLCVLIVGSAFYRYRNAPDPLDRFEVVAVEKNPDRYTYAVSYHYYRALYGANVRALSVVRGTPPPIGTRKAIWPRPVLVHRPGVPPPILSWQKPSGRLIAAFRASSGVVMEGDFLPCYRHDGQADICFDRNWVDVIVAGSRSQPDKIDGQMADATDTR